MARRFKADGFFRPFGMMRRASRSGNWSERSGRQMDGTMCNRMTVPVLIRVVLGSVLSIRWNDQTKGSGFNMVVSMLIAEASRWSFQWDGRSNHGEGLSRLVMTGSYQQTDRFFFVLLGTVAQSR